MGFERNAGRPMARLPSARRAAIDRSAVNRHPRAITLLMNMMFIRHLIALYRSFDGDLVEAVVLGEVAHHNLAPLFNASRTPHELSEALHLADVERRQTLLPTNAFSIAQATGIPRETVRRKVASLTRRGWLARDADGNLFVAADASRAFTTFNVERLRDLLETVHAIETLLADPAPQHDDPQDTGPSRRPRRSRPTP